MLVEMTTSSDRRDGHVALLRLNRPEARNALSPEMMERARRRSWSGSTPTRRCAAS